MPVYKAEGIVLRRRTLGEADRVVVLMTREWGRISCKAKGVRKTTSRLAGRLEPFVHGRFLLGRGRALDVIAQVEVIDGHPALRADLDRMSYASLVAELTDRLVAEREPHEEVFGLLLTALTLLSDADPARGAAWYALQLFRALGYEPVLDRCARCGGAVTPPAAWGTGLGGVLCDGCRAHDPTALLLDGETLGGMRFLARARARDTLRLRMTGRARDDVVGAVTAFAEARIEGRLRALRVLRDLYPSGGSPRGIETRWHEY